MNGTARLKLLGSLDLGRDKHRLAAATAFKASVDAIVQALESEHALQEKAPAVKISAAMRVNNPFG